MKLENNPRIPCFLCGKPQKIKISKSDKPYFVCSHCGIQVFVRYQQGIRKLRALLESINDSGCKFLALNESAYQVLSHLSRLEELRERLNNLRSNKGLSDFLLPDDALIKAERTLEKQIKKVSSELANGV